MTKPCPEKNHPIDMPHTETQQMDKYVISSSRPVLQQRLPLLSQYQHYVLFMKQNITYLK